MTQRFLQLEMCLKVEEDSILRFCHRWWPVSTVWYVQYVYIAHWEMELATGIITSASLVCNVDIIVTIGAIPSK